MQVRVLSGVPQIGLDKNLVMCYNEVNMDKILEFEKGKLFDENSKYYRFQCECLSPEDAMDIEVTSADKDGESKYVVITMHLKREGLWGRIKDAISLLRGDYCWREFVVRKEDMKYLSDIFNTKKGYSKLP